MVREVWAVGDAYEGYVGRWSRRVAEVFLRWLAMPAGRRWLDVGCGTGAVTATALAMADPVQVIGIDPPRDSSARPAAKTVIREQPSALATPAHCRYRIAVSMRL